MKIIDIIESTRPIKSDIRNAYIDFSKMTLSLVAVVTDVVRDGKPVIGYGFNSNGRYGQGSLIRERFPPDKDVVGRLALKNEFELFLQLTSGQEPGLSATLVSRQALLLAFDPVPEVCVGELLQLPTIKLMVVDQGRESVAAAIPNVPDERTLMK